MPIGHNTTEHVRCSRKFVLFERKKKWGRVIDKFPMYRIEKTNLDGLINKTIVLTFQQTLYL